MTICKSIKKQMTDALYNQLPQEAETRFRRHLETCAACAREYEELTALEEVMSKRQRPKMSEVYWESYMDKLDEKLDTLDAAEKVDPAYSPHPARRTDWTREWLKKTRWFFIPAAAAALLVVGVSVGLFFAGPEGQKLVDNTIASVKKLSPAVAAHFDNVQPVLLDYATYTPETAGETGTGAGNDEDDMVMVPKSQVKKLLIENQLLKRVVAKNDDITLKNLMDELEMLLLDLSNSDEDKAATRKAVQKYIKDNNLLFRMKVLKQKHDREQKEKETFKPDVV